MRRCGKRKASRLEMPGRSVDGRSRSFPSLSVMISSCFEVWRERVTCGVCWAAIGRFFSAAKVADIVSEPIFDIEAI
jgi:hypothetical protein